MRLLPPLLLLYAAAGTDAQLQYDLDECVDSTARTHARTTSAGQCCCCGRNALTLAYWPLPCSAADSRRSMRDQGCPTKTHVWTPATRTMTRFSCLCLR
eukprot:COSAG01_NODE_600_length_14996_cov_385.219434_6_plen_99_part_00